ARPFRHVSWRVRSVTRDRQSAAAGTVIPLPSPSECGPSASVRVGDGATSHTSSASQDTKARNVALEAKDLRVPRVVFRNIASTQAGSVSTPARLGGTRMVAAA
ncbi:MAG: hypothetical protein ABJO97_06495, partial [Roseibium sp.]|uniref:hypothetical protein n=1 Tax=Roseibium sp. TaxID=1936156 RepID=UPI003297F530